MDIIKIKDCNIQKIMDSGQCFRIYYLSRSNKYFVISKDKASIATQDGDNIELECLDNDTDYWSRYFNTDKDYTLIDNNFKSANIDFITKATDYSKGLRVLQQDLYETIISFIISQRKNISSIRKCIVNLSVCYGEMKEFKGIVYYAFPTVENLAGRKLDTIGLGYRQSYIEELIDSLYANQYKLSDIPRNNYEAALNKLKEIKGVGDKVANCVLLYSMGYTNAFPIDTWIQRIIDDDFGGNFPFDSIKSNKGILQLYMFYYKRYANNSIK